MNDEVTLTQEENAAWILYCRDTKGEMDVKNFWTELSGYVQMIYLAKVEYLHIDSRIFKAAKRIAWEVGGECESLALYIEIIYEELKTVFDQLEKE